jgi:hypothetical protein
MGDRVPSEPRRPRSSRQGWRSGATVVVLALGSFVVLLVLSCSGIREDEFDCEGAVAHLADCCPGFRAAFVDCSYQPSEGCSSPVFPDLSVAQSTCVRAESCASLVASGVCARASKLPLDGVTEDAGVPVVCP